MYLILVYYFINVRRIYSLVIDAKSRQTELWLKASNKNQNVLITEDVIFCLWPTPSIVTTFVYLVLLGLLGPCIRHQFEIYELRPVFIFRNIFSRRLKCSGLGEFVALRVPKFRKCL